MKPNWKLIASAPHDKPLLVCSTETGDQVIAKFVRLSRDTAVWGWVWAMETKDTRTKSYLLEFAPTHWAELLELPSKPKAKAAVSRH